MFFLQMQAAYSGFFADINAFIYNMPKINGLITFYVRNRAMVFLQR